MYKYEDEKSRLFTDEGQRVLFKVRDNFKELETVSGAIKASKLMAQTTNYGDTYLFLACMDRLVEIGEIKEITDSETIAQNKVYIRIY